MFLVGLLSNEKRIVCAKLFFIIHIRAFTIEVIAAYVR